MARYRSMAVGLERAHAEFVGQGEGLVVAGLGAIQGCAKSGNVALETQNPGLIAALLICQGVVKGLGSNLYGLVSAISALYLLPQPC